MVIVTDINSDKKTFETEKESNNHVFNHRIRKINESKSVCVLKSLKKKHK